ncbi:MAG TPA: hypothetical protein VHB98_23205 [Chloroflexota bacterium]|nr:hypothetical protein [Chloroflexota bacterium]
MKAIRSFLLFSTHSLTLLRGRILRWRLETYGLYMPSYPQQRPWWRINGRVLILLLRHGRAYAGWLEEMRAARQAGASGWWALRLGDRYGVLQDHIRRVNAGAVDQ